MARYQVIDTATGRKENIIEHDGSPVPQTGLYAGKRVEPDDGSPMWVALRALDPTALEAVLALVDELQAQGALTTAKANAAKASLLAKKL